MANCQLGHNAGKAIATGLMANAGVRLLDLRWNNIGAIGAKALVHALEYNTTLQHLKLDGNHVPIELLQLIEAKTATNRTAASARLVEGVKPSPIDYHQYATNQHATAPHKDHVELRFIFILFTFFALSNSLTMRLELLKKHGQHLWREN